jgi:hypothetical protein
MAIRKTVRKVCRVTPALIEEFVSMTMAKQDRPVRPRLLAALRAKVLKGEFRSTTWASVKCLEDGRTYRVNGKHTSLLFSQMNGELPKDIEVTLERYECDTRQEVSELYSSFDPRQSARSSADINRIYTAMCDALEGVTVKTVNNSVSGIALAKNDGIYPTNCAEDRASDAMKETEFILWANDVLNGEAVESLHLHRAPVFSAMFLTFHKDKDAATKFWALVRTGDGEAGCPTRKLERLLLTSRLSHRGVSGERTQKQMGQREMLAKCLHAWNAWRSGKSTDMKYHADCKLPDVK